jgi:Uma2 family endonuclease
VNTSLEAVAEARYQVSIDRFHRMVAAGVFEPDEAVELLEGMIASMPPEGPDHAGAIQVLNRALTHAARDAFWVRVQSPLTLPSAESEPEPDVALIDGSFDPHGGAHPTSAALVIEVARSSIVKDRTLKARVYARAGVAEYWIVHLPKRQIEVHRDPDPDEGRYLSLSTLHAHDIAQPLALPALAIRVSDIIG